MANDLMVMANNNESNDNGDNVQGVEVKRVESAFMIPDSNGITFKRMPFMNYKFVDTPLNLENICPIFVDGYY